MKPPSKANRKCNKSLLSKRFDGEKGIKATETGALIISLGSFIIKYDCKLDVCSFSNRPSEYAISLVDTIFPCSGKRPANVVKLAIIELTKNRKIKAEDKVTFFAFVF